MKFFNIFLFAVFLIFALYNRVTAQIEPAKTARAGNNNTDQSSFKIGVNYLSNNVFMGRSDSVRTPALLPSVKYSFAPGFYLSGSLYYITNRKKNKVDGGDLAAGYDFDINDDLSGGASFTKLFYNSNSTQVGSSISGTFNAFLSYDIGKILTATASAEYSLNRQGFGADWFFNFEIAHDFAAKAIFGDKDLFILSPTAAVNTGTQNFFDAYLNNKKYKNIKKTAAENKLIAAQKQTLSAFKLLNYEFSAPLEYKAGVFIFSFTPTYSFAENKLPASVASKLSTESGIFYFQTGAALKF